MKNKFTHLSLFILLTVGFFSLTSCGGNEKPAEAPAEEQTQSKAADLFTDDRPAYDASAINPDAEVVSLEIKAIGTSMSDMSYDPKTLTVKSGTTVKLKVINTSTDESMPHNWVLVHDGTMEAVATAGLDMGKENSYVPNSNDVLIATHLLGPKEETEITFPAPPPGKYQFVCTYPGHWTLMNGEFIVE